MIGRKTLKSGRARARQIDVFFERTAQVMLLTYALFVFVSWLSYRPAFRITHVAIDGLRAVSRDSIAEIAGDALASQFLSRVDRNNMLLYPRKKMLHEIRTLDPRIATVALSFDSRHTMRIVVHEYVVGALYCQSSDADTFMIGTPREAATSTLTTTARTDGGTRCYYADEQGYIFAEAAEWSGHPYVTFVSSSTTPPLRTHILPDDEYAAVGRFLSSLSEIDLRPQTVTILGNSDFRIETALPWDIFWSSKKDPQKSTDNLSLVLHSLSTMNERDKKILESIDLRFGDKIFYKNKGEVSRE